MMSRESWRDEVERSDPFLARAIRAWEKLRASDQVKAQIYVELVETVAGIPQPEVAIERALAPANVQRASQWHLHHADRAAAAAVQAAASGDAELAESHQHMAHAHHLTAERMQQAATGASVEPYIVEELKIWATREELA